MVVGIELGHRRDLAQVAVALLGAAEAARGLFDGVELLGAVVLGLPDLAEVAAADDLEEAVVRVEVQPRGLLARLLEQDRCEVLLFEERGLGPLALEEGFPAREVGFLFGRRRGFTNLEVHIKAGCVFDRAFKIVHAFCRHLPSNISWNYSRYISARSGPRCVDCG